MTQQKHLKALIRAQQSRTGESYSIACKQILDRLRRIEVKQVTEFKAHDRHANVVRFSTDGQELLSGGFKGQARIWSTGGWSLVGELVGHTESVNGFAVAAERVITVSSDRTVRLWDLPSRAEISTLGKAGKQVLAVDLDAGGARAWTGGFDGMVTHWTLDGEKTFETNVSERVAAIAPHPDRDWLAVGVVGPDLVVMDGGGESVARLGSPGEASVSICWASDGGFLVAAGPGGSISIWATENWEVVRRIDAPGGGVMPLAIDGISGLLAVGWEHHVGVWSPKSDEPVATVEDLPKGVYSLDFSPDGRRLAQCGADGKIRVWTVA